MDVAAMDGIINMIVLWKLGGELKNGKIVWPDEAAMAKLHAYTRRLKGGGVTDIIWNHLIDCKIITPEVDKILGSQKYEFAISHLLVPFPERHMAKRYRSSSS